MTTLPTRTTGNNVVILDLPGVVESSKLQEQANAFLEADEKKIAVNLEKIKFIESAGLGALVALFKTLDEQGGKVVFYGGQPYLENMVEITRINRVLTFYPSEADAVDALQ